MKKIISLIICAFTLQSCISTYGSGTPDGVKVYTTFLFVYALEGKTHEEASKHCEKYNKKAVLVDTTFITSKNQYKCIEK
jgi:hypothetical protein